MVKGIEISEISGRRVTKGLGYYPERRIDDLRELVKGSAARFGDAVGFRFKNADGAVVGKTYTEFDREIDCLGTALMKMGLSGARVAVISENRYEWGVCYFSIVNGTGVAVPLDKYLPKNEVENLIDRSEAEAIFFSGAFTGMMMEIAATNKRLKYFICMNDYDVKPADERFTTLSALVMKGREALDAGDRAFVDAPIDREKMSILLFTSGTTNKSKGVMLSHANIASNVTGMSTIIFAGPGDAHLSLLPLHHTFENSIGLMFMAHSGVCICYSDGIKHITQNLIEYKITILVVVPAILEAMYAKVREGIEKTGKAKLLAKLMKVSQYLRIFGIDLRRKLFKSVFEKLGPNLRLAVSGAAPLDANVIVWFDRLGLRVLQGFGLTETSPVISATNDFDNKFGTTGFPMKGIEVAIDKPDENGMGEIITRGPNVMLGYFEDPQATAEAIDAEGWFRTGDLGIIDGEGYLRITGRLKSMIVFPNGKKAFPEEFEQLLNGVEYVKSSFVWGNKATDGDIQVCAELVIDREKLTEAAGNAPSETELPVRMDAAIKEINKNLPKYKIIRYFVLTYEPIVITTTLKIKRTVEHNKIKARLNTAGIDMRKASGKFLETL